MEITDGDTRVSIPVSPTGINVVFADGPRTLAIEGGNVRIGSQVVSATATEITSPAEPGPLPDLAGPTVRGRLTVAEGSPVMIDGNVDVFGTSFDAESLTITGGDVAIRGGFTGGDDTISFTGPASDFTAVRIGSIVIIEGGDTRVSIPISPTGTRLVFGRIRCTHTTNHQVFGTDALSHIVCKPLCSAAGTKPDEHAIMDTLGRRHPDEFLWGHGHLNAPVKKKGPGVTPGP